MYSLAESRWKYSLMDKFLGVPYPKKYKDLLDCYFKLFAWIHHNKYISNYIYLNYHVVDDFDHIFYKGFSCIYFLVHSDCEVLYIGKSKNFHNRYLDHKRSKLNFKYIYVLYFPKDEIIDHYETYLIRYFRPSQNGMVL